MSIGIKIKTNRQKLNLTIPQLADIAGLSKGFISQVENDKVSVSLESLQKIASALKVPVKDFLTNLSFPPELVKKNGRPRLKLGDEPEVEILSSPFGRQLQVLMTELPPGYQAGNCAHTHEGEEWVMVLSGQVKVTQGDFSAILEVGDSIHWDGSCPHLCQNASEIPAKIIVALTPPAMLPVSKTE
ncbi:XRE family transcriptional regulator [Desulfosporosinus sp. PR]|uniref:helix-turn-helix domain-containing protein n=1 Tax=Candidatus Desulfosporosinus nitrosoreducens TaxID=3401928 RepID=UPI0027FE83CF|nr:XRE family transcriptional regulator [Desulfosporosinus sp. PR]MDQ7092942.1 XRE family transcriptional regulator [Desulfosporosinus sp. PR]